MPPSVNTLTPTTKPVIRKRRERWRKVTAAQEYIAGQSLGIAKSLVRAARKGDAATGRWLLEHAAIVDPDGKERRPIASSIDRAQIAPQSGDSNAPRILIGVSLGRDFAQLASTPTPQPLALSQPVSPEPIPAEIIKE